MLDEELPLPDSSVDRMLLVHFLEHLPMPGETLKEEWQVLSPDGLVVVVTPNHHKSRARFVSTCPSAPVGPSPAGSSARSGPKATSRLQRTPTKTLFYPPFKRHQIFKFHGMPIAHRARNWTLCERDLRRG
jgi:ubiquinone/menaquinone biosynthesis C-methylase UbiE